MAEYNFTDHFDAYEDTPESFEWNKGSWFTPFETAVHGPYKYILNRGTNGGGGAAYVYWLSPDEVDTSGTFYGAQSVPWAQITTVIAVRDVYPLQR